MGTAALARESASAAARRAATALIGGGGGAEAAAGEGETGIEVEGVDSELIRRLLALEDSISASMMTMMMLSWCYPAAVLPTRENFSLSDKFNSPTVTL